MDVQTCNKHIANKIVKTGNNQKKFDIYNISEYAINSYLFSLPRKQQLPSEPKFETNKVNEPLLLKYFGT